MSKFKNWMKTRKLKVTDIQSAAGVDVKTITKLRAGKNINKMPISVFTKLKSAYPSIKLKDLFPELKNICDAVK